MDTWRKHGVSGSPSRSFSAAPPGIPTRYKDLIASKYEDRLPPRRPHCIGVSYLLAGIAVGSEFEWQLDKKSQVK